MSAPKEFYIFTSTNYTRGEHWWVELPTKMCPDDSIHVIEKSAYDELKELNKLHKHQRDSWKKSAMDVQEVCDKRDLVIKDFEAENKHLDIYTCYSCASKDVCKFAWDHYNTCGDCLMEK